MKCQLQNFIILLIIDALKNNTSGIGKTYRYTKEKFIKI